LADRIKIARGGKGIEINLAVQFMLNCGKHNAGSCHGGSQTGVYHYIKSGSGFVPYDSCQPYLACSSESEEGLCPSVNTECSAINTCRTCTGFGQACTAISQFPNASISEWGLVHGQEEMMAEVFARGPIACSIAAEPIKDYTKGVFDDKDAPKVQKTRSLFPLASNISCVK
jgi:cathepsin X